ncbi:MAG: type IV secretion system protein [Sphingomicrobium sp.]
MNEHSRPSLSDYYEQAATWNQDRLKALTSSRRVAWWVAGTAAFIAVLEALALVFLAPLKTVVPYTLLVDRTTGYVQAIKPIEKTRIEPDTALTQSFLVQYVTARESFDINTLGQAYRKVALFSADQARNSYLSMMQANSPQNPLALYPRNAVIETRIKSVSPSGSDTAFVRFDTVRTDANGQAQPPSSWVAVIKYRYSGEPMKLEDRFVNPLGFRVISYRKDPEAPPPPASAVAAVAPGTVATPAAATTTVPAPTIPPSSYYGGRR